MAWVEFTPEGVLVGLHRRRCRPRCPRGWRATGAYDSSVRQWRHLGLGASKLLLQAQIRRLDCRRCGRVRTEAVPWARPRARHSRDFEDVVAWLAQHTDKTTISRLLRSSWETVAGIVTRAVAEQIDEDRLRGLLRIGAGSMLAAARLDHPGPRCRRGVGNAVRVEYVSRVPRPPLDGLIDDLYYLEGAPPYARLTLPPAPSALLIVNLGPPFLIRAGTDIETAEYADGCVVSTPTRALEFGYPPRTQSVGLHVKPWGLAPFLPMPASELCDRPVTIEQVWGRPAIAELRDRLATADGPHQMLTLLEEELMRRLCETAGVGLVSHTSSVIAATSEAVAIGDLSMAVGVSSTHLAQRFKQLIGVTPKRLARTYRFTAAVFAIDPAEPIDWADLAGRAGYFDQAHFGHEFRAFTGLTPTRYVEVRRRFLREHPGHVLDGWPLPAD